MTTLYDDRKAQHIELIEAQNSLSVCDEDHPEYLKLSSNVDRLQKKIDQRPAGISLNEDSKIRNKALRSVNGKPGFTEATIHQSGVTETTIHP